jgi:hypothetical protein
VFQTRPKNGVVSASIILMDRPLTVWALSFGCVQGCKRALTYVGEVVRDVALRNDIFRTEKIARDRRTQGPSQGPSGATSSKPPSMTPVSAHVFLKSTVHVFRY